MSCAHLSVVYKQTISENKKFIFNTLYKMAQSLTLHYQDKLSYNYYYYFKISSFFGYLFIDYTITIINAMLIIRYYHV